ncbi:conserved hypothetical protein [Xenorhabdus szentirmaii DSM 16338]|uniref:Uncharacterized protein n=2 Tax=Xenorhabdus TaxID=626 RepID=W1J4E4_9GAMM|nr:hypothetical protein Xsze_04272 [Xenorhabdus szentirmaii DSM 16338]CDL85637.1 conserved hypothetical protein [Xenorhabdus szentirmaii DSM 16338]
MEIFPPKIGMIIIKTYESSPDLRDTNIMRSINIGTGNEKSTYQLGIYRPCFWNNVDVIEINNCYHDGRNGNESGHAKKNYDRVGKYYLNHSEGNEQ